MPEESSSGSPFVDAMQSHPWIIAVAGLVGGGVLVSSFILQQRLSNKSTKVGALMVVQDTSDSEASAAPRDSPTIAVLSALPEAPPGMTVLAPAAYESPRPDTVAQQRACAMLPQPSDINEGEIEVAAGDSWVGSTGEMRAFIGKVRESKFKEKQYEESLFVCDIPKSVDITTASSGSRTEFPTPPQGVVVRRLTHSWAGGIVRGSPSGKMIAYYGKDVDGVKQ
eukprot:gene7434-8852_t